MNDLATIASRATLKRTPFLLAGGHAVIAHGFARSTFDLDLIVPKSDRGEWLQMTRELGYQLLQEGPAFAQFHASKPESFTLDLMFVNSTTFSKLQAEAVPAGPGAPGVQIVSLMHLLALKCHAVKHGHRGRIVKDAEYVIQLIQSNTLDPEAEEMRELFKKHGTEEFYEKVKAACRHG